MSESYTLVILCQRPHSRYNRRIPFNWYPSGEEIFNSIRRLRAQANTNYDSDVKIKAVMLRKTETIEYDCVDLDAVNGLTLTIDQDEKKL